MNIDISYITDKAIEYVGSSLFGIILFGSYARGDYDEYSDVDIAIITVNKSLSPRLIKLDNTYIELAFIPKTYYEYLLDQLYERDDHMLWVTHTLYLKILREGEILYDPYNQLVKWKKMIRKWKWSNKDLEEAIQQLHTNLEIALIGDRVYGELAYRIGLIKYIELFIIIKAMKKDLIPSLQPKDLYSYARILGLYKTFREFEGIKNIDKKQVKEIMHELKTVKGYIPRLKNIWRRILIEFYRNNFDLALLYLRKLHINYLLEKSPNTPYIPYNAYHCIELLNQEENIRILKMLYNLEFE